MKIILSKGFGLLINIISLVLPKIAAKLALLLFSTPLKGRIKELQSDFLDTAFNEELTYKEIPIRTYRWLGKNKTILLAHGWESNAARWKDLIHNLKKHDYNIIAFDGPAHGRSGSKSFNAILYSEFINVVCKKFNPEIIIGHSVGGMASVFYQHKHQNATIEKLILLGAPAHFTGVFKRYKNMMSYTNRVFKYMNGLIQERFGNTPEYFSTAEFVKEITTKGFIIHDIEDKIIPFSDAELIHKNYKNSSLISTKGLGHSLNNDAAIVRVLESLND